MYFEFTLAVINNDRGKWIYSVEYGLKISSSQVGSVLPTRFCGFFILSNFFYRDAVSKAT